MITIITGASLSGKTNLAHRLMIRTQTPYISQDHLKMGLIRSGETTLSVEEDEKMTEYLWPICVGMIKTAIENKQDLIVEGVYVPDDWITSFDDEHLADIRFVCLVMSENYINNNFEAIVNHAEVIEERMEQNFTKEKVIEDNQHFFDMCENNLYPYIYIDDDYIIDIEALLI